MTASNSSSRNVPTTLADRGLACCCRSGPLLRFDRAATGEIRETTTRSLVLPGTAG